MERTVGLPRALVDQGSLWDQVPPKHLVFTIYVRYTYGPTEWRQRERSGDDLPTGTNGRLRIDSLKTASV
jgi:hypothetical protein